jgi:hypothetical protein
MHKSWKNRLGDTTSERFQTILGLAVAVMLTLIELNGV